MADIILVSKTLRQPDIR